MAKHGSKSESIIFQHYKERKGKVEMKITHVHIENFRNLKDFDADFSDKTVISGQNATGKTTVRNAIFYALTGKLADGSATDNIRPHDESGNDIDNVDIVVELTLDVDGRKVVLKKVEKQKWTKHKGSEAPTFEGNVTEYSINDIPKKAKDYAEFIQNIASPEILLHGTNAAALLNLDTKKRRAILMGLASDVNMEIVAQNNSKYESILPILADGTIDELISRSRKVIKEKNEELKSIPVRIDELSKMIVERDTAELELLKNSLKESIAKVEESMKSGDNRKEISDLEDKHMDVIFQINDIKRKVHEESENNRHKLNSDMAQAEMKLSRCHNSISLNNEKLADYQDAIKANKARIEALKPEYKELKESAFDESKWVFDESTTICSLCGQKLPDAKIAELKKDFASKKEAAVKAFQGNRNAKLEAIKNEGNGLANKNKELDTDAALLIAELDKLNKEMESINKEIADFKSQLALLPTEEAMLSENSQYKKLLDIEDRISEEVKRLEAAVPDTSELEDRKAVLETQLNDVVGQLAKVAQNVEIEDRIKELTARQRQIAQQVADAEQQRDLLEALNKEYVEVTTSEINKNFKYVSWRMFKQNITNSGYEQICEPVVGGTSYYRGLNHGARILAEVDICSSFQDLGGVKLPITIDDAESVDEWRLPEINRQIVVFRRTDDKELTVKNL